MDEVVDNIGTITDKKLAIVIATHAHQDHISGFNPEKFGKFQIGEVWMPWTEDPKDAKAATLKKKHVALAAQLNDHFEAQAFSGARVSKSRAAAAAAVANLVAKRTRLKACHQAFALMPASGFFKPGTFWQGGDV